MKRVSFLFLALESNGERKKDDIIFNGDIGLLVSDCLLDSLATYGDFLMLDSSMLEPSSIVPCDSRSQASSTVLGERFSVFAFEPVRSSSDETDLLV